jgi:hypothetical protein
VILEPLGCFERLVQLLVFTSPGIPLGRGSQIAYLNLGYTFELHF